MDAPRLLEPFAILRFPPPARDGDWVTCIGFDAHHALFLSVPNREPTGRYDVDAITVDRATGAVIDQHHFVLEDDWFAAISFEGRCAITRRGHLRSLPEGRLLTTLSLGDPHGLSFWTFAADGRTLLGAHHEERKWIYSVRDPHTGIERSRATGVAPMMVYANDALSKIVVVGSGRHVAREWQTNSTKMSIIRIPVEGEPMFTPDLSRWMVWTREGITVGGRDVARSALTLPTELAGGGLRYSLGNEIMVFFARLEDELRIVAFDLASGRLEGELRMPGAAGPSAPPFVDRTSRRILFVTRDGVCTWRLGDREYARVRGGITGLNVVSSVVGESDGPWKGSGFYVADDNALAFYD